MPIMVGELQMQGSEGRSRCARQPCVRIASVGHSRRHTEAVLKIGSHANLLRVLQFEFIDEDHEFFEVTEWSEFGTLHGYLTNKDRGELTLRERLEIAEGVAAALEAVHAHDVVHRNL